MKELQPYSDKVILEQISESEKSDGGIIRPDIDKRQWKLGKVLAVGQGFYTINGTLITPQTYVGDIVVFPKAHAVEFKHEGQKLYIIRESELYSKILKKDDNEE